MFELIFILLFHLYSFCQVNTDPKLYEAKYYVKLDKEILQCQLCPRRCILSYEKRGYCGVRKNINGKLYSLVYGRPVSMAIDPIEKKPVFHMLPGSKSFSFATVGCNLRCIHCQNFSISQALPEDIPVRFVPPEEIIAIAKRHDCQSISYTYTEPTVFFEYMVEIAKLAKKNNIRNVWVTSGYINKEPLLELCKYLDVARVDLKGFSDEFYKKIALGDLQVVLNTLLTLKSQNIFIEVVNLIIPTYNDDFETIKKMCVWIKENLGDETPLFFTRFFPHHKLASLQPTPVTTLTKARKIALGVGLKYVYIGNVVGNEGESTYCPKCKKILIGRIGYSIFANDIKNGRCKNCGQKIPGIWN